MSDGGDREVSPVGKRRRDDRSAGRISDSSFRREPFDGFERRERVVTQDNLDNVTAGINAKMDKVSADIDVKMDRIQSLLMAALDNRQQPLGLSQQTSVPGTSGRCANVSNVLESADVGTDATTLRVEAEVHNLMYDEDDYDDECDEDGDDDLRYGSGANGVSFDVTLPGNAAGPVSLAAAGVNVPPIVQDDKVLDALVQDYKKDILGFEYAGEPVYPAMADMLALCMYKQPNRASLESLLKAYPCPENVPCMKPLDMNDAVVSSMSKLSRTVDVMLRDVCGISSTVMVPYLTFMTDHHNGKPRPLVEYYRMFSDAVRLSAMNMSFVCHVRKLIVRLLFKSPALRAKCTWATQFGERKIFPFTSVDDLIKEYNRSKSLANFRGRPSFRPNRGRGRGSGAGWSRAWQSWNGGYGQSNRGRGYGQGSRGDRGRGSGQHGRAK